SYKGQAKRRSELNTAHCRSRLAGDAMVNVPPPSLASQLLQG
ncbi:hypothetical protein QF012_005415, partial [Pseudomonas laurylsulfatiphila]